MAAAAPGSDSDRLAAIYREEFAYVFRVLVRLGVPREAVEDVAQDVFLVVNRRLADFQAGAPVRPWLFGIARRVAAERRKRVTRAQRRLELLPPRQPPSGPDQRVDAADASRFLHAFLDRLADPDREMFVLCELEAVTGTEAAAALGVNRNTLYARLRKLRTKFAREVSDHFAVGGGR